MAVSVVATISVATALAHTEINVKFSGGGSGWCMYSRSAVNGEDRGTGATVLSYQEGCVGFKIKDPYKLRAKDNLLKENSNGVWNQCSEGSLVYNYNPAEAAGVGTYYGGRPCGAGRYRTRALTGLFDSGDWKSDTADSPPHQW